MATAYNSNIVKAELRYQYGSEEVENTLYFFVAPPHDASTLAILASEIFNVYNTTFRSLQSGNLSLREIYMRSMSGLVAPEYSFTAGLPTSGTNLGNPHPNNVTLAISFRSGLTGRSSRGRNYILGLTKDQTTDNVVDSDVISAYVSAYELMLPSGGEITAGIWVIYSQYTGGAIRPTGTFNFVLSVVVTNDVVDSQRRRLPGRGQ